MYALEARRQCHTKGARLGQCKLIAQRTRQETAGGALRCQHFVAIEQILNPKRDAVFVIAPADAAKALKAAAKTNPHVPGLLLDRQPMPKTPPPYYAVGSKDEAVLYVLENRENWSAAKGALKWLAETA